MRFPSRCMPKILKTRIGIFGWTLLAGIAAFFVWLVIVGLQNNPMAMAAGLVFILVCGVAASRENRRRLATLKALATARQGETLCAFAREFDPRETDTWIIRAVYEQLQLYLGDEDCNFPIRAGDALVGLLMVDPDDLDMDIVQDIAARTGRSLDQLEQNPHFGRVRTVRDLVQFFNVQPLKNAT